MLRLPRQRDLDPDLRRRHLPFLFRPEWIVIQVLFGIFSHFLWALLTVYREPLYYRFYLRLSVPLFVFASLIGYNFARLGSRFLGTSLLNIRRGKERLLDTRLGKATVTSGIALATLPHLIGSWVAGEVMISVPFYSGVVFGMGFSFFLWVSGLPR
ncbi:MAG: hypothetical protein KatS3mg115_1738 [Candidatus Poribacteria bacterium]|nr:MAG: hypothetical protein KatS3mg115_1738 [Candidatus Poribacteria bacterium]